MNVKDVYTHGFANTSRYESDPRLVKVLQIVRERQINAQRMLDMGCGDGVFTRVLGEALGASGLYGFDISKHAVKLALKNNIAALTLDIDLVNLPFKNHYFDIVFSGNLIELILNADHLLSEAHRVLSPDGTFIVTFPNMCSWGSRIAVPLGFLPYYGRVSTLYDLGKLLTPTKRGDSTGFIRLFSVQSFRELAGLHGLSVDAIYGAHVSVFPPPISLLDRVVSLIPSLAFQVIVLLRKT